MDAEFSRQNFEQSKLAPGGSWSLPRMRTGRDFAAATLSYP